MAIAKSRSEQSQVFEKPLIGTRTPKWDYISVRRARKHRAIGHSLYGSNSCARILRLQHRGESEQRVGSSRGNRVSVTSNKSELLNRRYCPHF